MQFEVKTYDVLEGTRLVQVTAGSADAARTLAEQRGARVLSVRALSASFLTVGKTFSVESFGQELLALLEAGLSLIESIEIIGRKSRAGGGGVVEELTRRLKEGQSFSTALESQPHAFPTLLVSMVRASEQTGDLASALSRYLGYQQQLNMVRNRVASALIYPALLVVVGLAVIVFLLVYVVPRFSRIYEDLGTNLPWTSRMLVSWSGFIEQYGGMFAIALLAGLGALAASLARPSSRARMERAIWSLPTVGEKVKTYQLARFTRTLSMLVKGGIPFVSALELVAGLLRQPALQMGLAQATRQIREGRSISDAFAASDLGSEVAIRLIAVGENSGAMGDALERVAKLYDDEITRWVDWFTRLFEPLLMLGIGIGIGLIVILMYLPVFELANSLQ